MALHWKDVQGKEMTPYPAGNEIGWDVGLALIDKYPQKTMLVETALHLGFYLGSIAAQGQANTLDNAKNHSKE